MTLKIEAAGFYDIPEDTYHADPCAIPSLTRSVGKEMYTKSPRHGWIAHPRLNPAYVTEQKAVFDVGKAAETLLLKGEGDFDIVDAADWRTAKAKEARAAAWAAGRIPMLADRWEEIRQMADAARIQLESHLDAADAFTNGKPQQTAIWDVAYHSGPIWCRCLFDWLPDPGITVDAKKITLTDFKTTEGSAHPDVWSNRLYDAGADLQAEFYCRGFAAVVGIPREDVSFQFVVQESKPPFALSVVGLAPRALELASHKVDRMQALWARCMAENVWPGYSAHTYWVEPPMREEYRLEDRINADHAAKSDGKDIFDLSVRMQAPLGAG